MANEQNLKPPSTKEARKRGSKGGKASVKARREKKAMQELAKIVLHMPYEGTEGDLDEIERICFDEFPDKHLTVGERALLAVAKKAMKGDANALTFLRDTAGEKPADKVEITGEVEKAAADIQAMIAAEKAKGDG